MTAAARNLTGAGQRRGLRRRPQCAEPEHGARYDCIRTVQQSRCRFPTPPKGVSIPNRMFPPKLSPDRNTGPAYRYR
jgi:hypothetical protein